jgi:hypothetical protein
LNACWLKLFSLSKTVDVVIFLSLQCIEMKDKEEQSSRIASKMNELPEDRVMGFS